MLNKITGELTDPRYEIAFLVSVWPRTRLFCRTLFGATAVIILSLVIVNLRDPAINLEMLIVMTPARLLQTLSYVYMFYISFKANRPSNYDLAIVATQIFTLGAEFANDIMTVLPQSDGNTPPMPFLLIILFVYYTLLPSRFAFTIIFGMVVTVVYTAAAAIYFPNVWYLLLEFIFVNLIGISFGRFINRLQRQDYMNRTELELARAEAIKARQVAEQASTEKSKFIAVASHDLRQPLHAMGLWIDTLNQQAGEHAGSPLATTVAHLIRAKDSLDGLLDRLLHASHLDSGTTVVRPEPLMVKEVLADIGNRFQDVAAQKEISLQVRSGDQQIVSDPILLSRILDNLVDNAIKYGHAGSRVLLGTRRRGDACSIQVWNQGDQIPPGQLDHIFEEFHQVAHQDGKSFRGLGLGLSIVKRLCELLGHPIRVRSHDSGLTKFEVEVKLARSELTQPVTASRPLSPHESLDINILVIDDDPEILAAMEQLLTRWDARVMLAGNQSQAFRVCQSEGGVPDLIISDQHLGSGENGIDVVRALHQELGFNTPVILMSGETSAESLRIANASGYPLFTKPVKPAKLKMAILQAVS